MTEAELLFLRDLMQLAEAVAAERFDVADRAAAERVRAVLVQMCSDGADAEKGLA